MRVPFTLLACSALLLASCAEELRRPDVVIVVVDTLRPDRIGSYGCDRELTPALDRLAGESVVYEDCQSAAPWTAPSLISLMTSTRPRVHGVTSFPVPEVLSPGVRTLAEELQAAGYESAAFTEGGYAQGSFGLARGFDSYPSHAGDEQGFHSNVDAPSRLKGTIDRALVWLAEERAAPRLLFVHTYEVHHPLRPPERDLAALRPGYSEDRELASVRAIIERWNRTRSIDTTGARGLRRHSFHHDFAGMPAIAEPDRLLQACDELGVTLDKSRAQLDDNELGWLQDLYDAEVRYTDRQLGRLFEALDHKPSPNGTILIVTSDHGEGLGAYGRLGHGEIYSEELLRVLLMIRAPGVPAGRVQSQVRTIDVMPTVLALAGLDTDGLALQGRDLEPAVAKTQVRRGHAIGQALSSFGGHDPRVSIKRGTLRLTASGSSADLALEERRLHDLSSDPGEQHDLARSQRELADELEAVLLEELQHDELLRRHLGDPTAAGELDEAQLAELRRLGYLGD